MKFLEEKEYNDDYLFDIKQAIFDLLNDSNIDLILVELIKSELNKPAEKKDDKKDIK